MVPQVTTTIKSFPGIGSYKVAPLAIRPFWKILLLCNWTISLPVTTHSSKFPIIPDMIFLYSVLWGNKACVSKFISFGNFIDSHIDSILINKWSIPWQNFVDSWLSRPFLICRLTVEDSDHATNFSTANVTVVKVSDYPPEANAGQDVIIYLPNNNVTLNGNMSTDDHGIASWEWTKSPSDQDKAVDMQRTRTPYLELSNLVEGMYTFTLKVTDDNGESSSSDVHVFVKPPTNKPPIGQYNNNNNNNNNNNTLC